ncbi:MAG TPA: hypothetical protein VIJ22_06280, partial [Polyangiaceae bacterium]
MSTRRTTTTRLGIHAAQANAHESRAVTHAGTAESDGFDPAARVSVNKAYKMYVGGAFIRSESGR